MQKNNHSNAAALKTATPKNGYKVTPETAAILDCVRATDELCTRIIEMLRLVNGNACGEDIADTEILPYIEHTNAITDLLHKELQTRLVDNLGDVANCCNPDGINI